MGSDCDCSLSLCNDTTPNKTTDLSKNGNKSQIVNKINNHSKINLNKISTIESGDPLLSQREKESKSTTFGTNYKKNSLASFNSFGKLNNKSDKKLRVILNSEVQNNNQNNNKPKKINKKILKNKSINNDNIKNNNKTNNKESKNNINKKEKRSSLKDLDKEELVSENFKNFMNTPQGEEMALNMEQKQNKFCITLHKYFLKLITKREFKKNIRYYVEKGDNLYKTCVNNIYNSNPKLKKIELNSVIKYSPKGYLNYYSDEKDIENMKFNNPKECFDNCIVINYSENNSSSLDNMLWVYKGQVNKKGEPHGFGEKLSKNGTKEKGYWKDGQMFGWGEMIDIKGNIFIGPFYNNQGITGKGEKYTLKRKILYKGEFVKGQKSGKGEENSNEGQFIGSFYKDKKDGKGKMIYKLSGDIYEGEYKNDLFDGNGHYIWKTTGQEYKGEYKNGLMNGKGLFEWGEGEFYRGHFVNGKKEGTGELHMGDGRIFIGPFANGRPNGIGVYDNGINFKGEMEFIDGKMNLDYIRRRYSSNSLKSFNSNNSNNKDEKN